VVLGEWNWGSTNGISVFKVGDMAQTINDIDYQDITI
jgi:hypothetical protein